MNHCDECGLDFLYDPKYHECAHKQRPVSDDDHVGESWIDQCLRMQKEGHS